MEIAKENLLNTPPELLNDFKYFKKFEMTIQPQNSLGVKGKIYLLVDRHVYSSAEMFASFAKNTGFATLVGNTTGGDGIGQDPLFYSLPHSGYILRFPSVMGLTHDGSCNEEHKTVPDIRVNTDINQDKSQDTAIQYVLNLYK
jgi:C-terminal processing protease CtpA/Prc